MRGWVLQQQFGWAAQMGRRPSRGTGGCDSLASQPALQSSQLQAPTLLPSQDPHLQS